MPQARALMQNSNDPDAFSSNGKWRAWLEAAVAEVASLPPGGQKTWALRGLASLLVGTPEAFKASRTAPARSPAA